MWTWAPCKRSLHPCSQCNTHWHGEGKTGLASSFATLALAVFPLHPVCHANLSRAGHYAVSGRVVRQGDISIPANGPPLVPCPLLPVPLSYPQAAEYAMSRRVVLKGDLPIGVDKRSVDCWVAPHLFRTDKSTGAPPDAFSPTGRGHKLGRTSKHG